MLVGTSAAIGVICGALDRSPVSIGFLPFRAIANAPIAGADGRK
jgi:hypothetical protein